MVAFQTHNGPYITKILADAVTGGRRKTRWMNDSTSLRKRHEGQRATFDTVRDRLPNRVGKGRVDDRGKGATDRVAALLT